MEPGSPDDQPDRVPWAKIVGTDGTRLLEPEVRRARTAHAGRLVSAMTGTAVTTYAVCEGYRFSSEKAKRELGYTLSPIREAIREAIAWQRARGSLR